MAKILDTVKTALQITGDGFDAMLNIHIVEAKEYLKSAGIPESLIESETCSGLICHMVIDTWSLNGGEAKYSQYTQQRIIQLQNAREEGQISG